MSEAMTISHRDIAYPKAASRMAVMVLGMHRSGTSALTRLLNLLGCDAPKNLMPAVESNAHGFWESSPITALNDEILGSAGSRWNDWQEFNPNWIKSPAFDQFMKRGVGLVEQEFGGSHLFVLKDPRNCILMPFWRAVLDSMGINQVAIHTVRHPLEVIESLKKRDNLNAFRASLLWLYYNIYAEISTRDMPRFFTSYDEILNNEVQFIDKSQSILNVFWPRNSSSAKREIANFLSASARHHHFDMSDMDSLPPYSSELVGRAYSILRSWADNGESTDFGILQIDEISREFDTKAAIYERISAEMDAFDAEAKALQSKLQQSEMKLVAAEGERDEARSHAASSAKERDDVRRLAEEAKARIEILTKERDEARRLCHGVEVRASERERQLQNVLSEHQDTISALKEALNGIVLERNTIIAKKDESGEVKLSEEKAECEAQLMMRFEEIATLTHLLRDAEEKIARLQ